MTKLGQISQDAWDGARKTVRLYLDRYNIRHLGEGRWDGPD